MKNPRKTLLIIGISLIILGIASVITASILEISGNRNLCQVFLIIAGGIGALALIVMIFGFIFFGVEEKPHESPVSFKVKEVRTVDVKDIPKTKEQSLYEEYEKLHEQGLISKEDLETKRKELLGK